MATSWRRARKTDDGRLDYKYGERQLPDLSDRELRPGHGRISGFISLILGAGSILGVRCFHYPEILTTRELRQVYDVDLV